MCMHTHVTFCKCVIWYTIIIVSVSFQLVAVQAVSVTEETVSTTSVVLVCTLPCFSPYLRCNLSNITTNGVNAVNISIIKGSIVGSMMSYSYPTQRITISNLMDNNTTYNYCVVAINMNNMTEVGEPVCDSFIARAPSPPSPTPTATLIGTYVRTYIHTYIHTYVHMYIHINICTYIYINYTVQI